MKRILVAIIVTAMALSSSLTVFAAPETMPDGTVFDAEYYAQNNPDVAFTDEDPEYVMYSFPPNNGVEYEVGEVMAADRHGHVMTYAGVFDTSDFL